MFRQQRLHTEPGVTSARIQPQRRWLRRCIVAGREWIATITRARFCRLGWNWRQPTPVTWSSCAGEAGPRHRRSPWHAGWQRHPGRREDPLGRADILDPPHNRQADKGFDSRNRRSACVFLVKGTTRQPLASFLPRSFAWPSCSERMATANAGMTDIASSSLITTL